MKKNEISKEAEIHIKNFIIDFMSDDTENILISSILQERNKVKKSTQLAKTRSSKQLIKNPEIKKKTLEIMNKTEEPEIQENESSEISKKDKEIIKMYLDGHTEAAFNLIAEKYSTQINKIAEKIGHRFIAEEVYNSPDDTAKELNSLKDEALKVLNKLNLLFEIKEEFKKT